MVFYPLRFVKIYKNNNQKFLGAAGQGYVILNFKARNSKSEIAVFQTNPNDQKINDQNKNHRLRRGKILSFVLNFKFLDFEFVSNFVLRASDLL